MNDPIFVKVRNDEGIIYPSYDIIYQLIDWAGFPTCELSEINPKQSDAIYIFPINNGNVSECCHPNHWAKYILWNIEIPGQVGTECPDYMDEMWVSCRYFYNLIEGNKKKFVPIGGDVRLSNEPNPVKQWDFIHSSYLYGKRATQVAELETQGFTMAPNDRKDRIEALTKSRWGLCLHQHNTPALSPQRMTVFACNKLPIILENVDSPEPYKVVMLSEFDRNKDYNDLADYNFNLMTNKMTFRKCVETALNDK